MIGTLVLAEPQWLALALGGACATVLWWRGAHASTAWRPRAAWLAPLVGVAAAALAAALLRSAGLAVHMPLGVAAVVLIITAAWAAYGEAPFRRGRRTLLATLRSAAWIGALAIVVRPSCDQTRVVWERPVFAVLLDDSASMGLADRVTPAEPPRSRAERANVALAEARESIAQLADLFDVRLLRIGPTPEPAQAWAVVPDAPLTGLAAGLQFARGLRSRAAGPPAAVVLISDGAETVLNARAVRAAAAELTSQSTPLLAIGVGPRPGEAVAVELEPLAVPARIGVRERLRVPVAARVMGCRETELRVALLWDQEIAVEETARVASSIERVDREFELAPPGPGVHRLTARVKLPPALGAEPFAVSTLVDVVDDRMRVLYVESAPRTEAAFVTRAWQGDPQLEVTRRFLESSETGTGRGAVPDDWQDFDVVVLGDIRTALPAAATRALADAISQRGVGLLLCGGRRFFNSGDYARSALADASPVQLDGREYGLRSATLFQPTLAGRTHPALRGVAEATGAQNSDAADEAAWRGLPRLIGAAAFGTPKPAALVLATDATDRPLLVAQEFGRGRVLAAAWEVTWPWALASEEGAALQRRLWRQLVGWLANRQPAAWVVTDQPAYTRAALATRQRRVVIRAGLSGIGRGDGDAARSAWQVQLLLSCGGRPGAPTVLPVRRVAEQWTAELPAPGDEATPAPGRYTLEFRATPEPAAAVPVPHAGADALTARTSFDVVDVDPEQQAPTANLELLRAIAEPARESGGGYYDVTSLPAVLAQWAQKDLRTSVEVRERYDLVARIPWGLFGIVLGLLSAEWALRRRGGLV